MTGYSLFVQNSAVKVQPTNYIWSNTCACSLVCIVCTCRVFSSSSSVDQLDAGRRPVCPIHCVDPFLN